MWAIVLTSRDHEYFINLTTHEAAWEMPDDIAELVGQIMAGAGYDTDENEIVEDDGEEVNDNSHPLSSQINQYDELQDEKEVVRVYESSSASLAEMEAHVRQQELEHGFEKKHGVGNSSKRHADQMQQNGSQSDSKKKSKKVESEGELTNAEKQAMFMDMLEEVETNPFSTWEKELDQFTDDPRYVQIPTAKLRKNYFETYCKNKAAQIHKQRSANEIKTPKETFRAFLDDVLGTADWRKLGSLSAYDDFSRKWKRDPRFTVISDDRDRKAMFKEFVTRMKAAEGERKRAEKQQIQDNFFELLRSVEGINNESRWRDVQRKIDRDKRYNVIPTPIQREDLFREFLKISALEKASSEAERKEIERKAREVESLRQREETVRKQKTNLAREVRKSQFIMKSSESVDLLKNLLVDLIKSHKTTLKDSVTYLATDARFDQIMLSEHELEELFKEHTTNIFKKRLTAWHNFINEITLIITPFEDVSEILLKDPRTSRLECTSEDELARLYKEYQTEREQKARSELEVCLKENGFVRFHVKSAVGNCHVEAVEKGLKEAEPGAEWRLIGLDEVKSVLQEDKRYNDFECFPAERDRIVFSFMKQLIEECRGEKGGVLDSIVARNAGGHVERK
ncbi:transcription elongation regulator [Physocladia obscura]|uniref:Transcription elongation regulator n=1 Tax=Physocladia obscura TaxID=109957 RepID=A0AAD5T204_9FUNG|nr:transcription elongation regulator [Physocladia obscura]